MIKSVARVIPPKREDTHDRFRVKYGDGKEFEILRVTIIRKKTNETLVYEFNSVDLTDHDTIHFSTRVVRNSLHIDWDDFISNRAKLL